MKLKFRSFEDLLDEYLENPEFAMSFLNQALADEDVEAFKLSLTDVIRTLLWPDSSSKALLYSIQWLQ